MGTGGGLIIIDFSDRGNSARFQGEGWSGQEPDRVWAIGPRSVLRIPLQSSDCPTVLEVELAPCHAPPEIVGQIVRVRVNGTAIGGVRLNSRSMIRCEVDPSLARPDGILEIEFGCPGFYVPGRLPGSAEERPLSCWFSFVRAYTTDMFRPGPHFPTSHPSIQIIGLSPPLIEIPASSVPPEPTNYTFGATGTALPFLREGWDVSQDDFALTTASFARLELPVPAVPGDYALRLDVRAPASSDPVPPRDVTILLDGLVIGQFSLDGSTSLSAPLPRELSEGRDCLRLTLVPSVVAGPDDASASAEVSSPGGVAVSQIVIVPLSSCMSSNDVRERTRARGKVSAADSAYGDPSELGSTDLETYGPRPNGGERIEGDANADRDRRTSPPGDSTSYVRYGGLSQSDGYETADARSVLGPLAVDHVGRQRMAASRTAQPDVWEDSPRDVVHWVRYLPLHAPRDMRDVFLLLAQHRAGEPFDSLLDRIDFFGVTAEQVFELIIGRPPTNKDFSAGLIHAGPRETFQRVILSRKFRERSLFAFLDAFLELARDIFIHVPKCAGTDLIMNLGSHRRRMPLPYMLRFPEWISDDDFLTVLGGLAQSVPHHERIFVYGHMILGEFPAGFQLRPRDKIFSIIRDPLGTMVSHANYAIGRLRQDPEGLDPDTAETLAMLDMPRLPDGLSDSELKALVVRVLFDPKFSFANNACRHLGPIGSRRFDDAIANIASNDVEITTTKHYERWLRERWGISRSNRHNRSDTILTEHEARRLYSRALLDMTIEDLKLFSLVTWAIERAGTPSVTGQQIMRLAAPKTPMALAGELITAARQKLASETMGVFVIQDAVLVDRYLQAASVVVPGGQQIEEVASLRFGATSMGVKYLHSGWAVSEGEFTWTRGKKSTIRLPPFKRSGTCVIRMVGWPFIVKDTLPSQEILISVNRNRIGSCTIQDRCVIEFEIPPAVTDANKRLDIQLTVPGAKRPSAVSESRDRRLLGFCLEQIMITNYSSEPENVPTGQPESSRMTAEVE